MRTILILCVTLSFLLLCSIPQAISCTGPECQDDILAYGKPYNPDPSSSTINYYASNNWIKYYIPLSSANSGIFGVNAGTTQDYGSGYGYGNANTALSMFLEFDLTGAPVAPSYEGYLKFYTIDLDLLPDNDPENFKEDIQFYFTSSGGGAFQQATDVITSSGASGATQVYSGNWAVGGSGDYLTITFSDLVIPGDPYFMAQLDFSSMYNNSAWNTKEWLKAELCVHPVPIPAAIWLLGFGMTGLGILRKYKLKS